MGKDDNHVCVVCRNPLLDAGVLRQVGLPKYYQLIYYCNNTTCIRYGLLSIYKLADDKSKENV